ncbi:hypothetical protein CGSMWGv00703Bmash_00829 [Gardnerella pickettii 00703Bmash]|nr:hypothetical protein CGSMWGv00703Bmash_00829 [Gardnerella pickettii 00703Bmash]
MSGVKKPAPAPCWQRELSHPHIDNNMIPPVYVVHYQYYFDSIAHVLPRVLMDSFVPEKAM